MEDLVHTDVTAILRAIDAGLTCRVSGPNEKLRRAERRLRAQRPDVDTFLGHDGVKAYTPGVWTAGTFLYVSPTGNAATTSMGAALP